MIKTSTTFSGYGEFEKASELGPSTAQSSTQAQVISGRTITTQQTTEVAIRITTRSPSMDLKTNR